MDFIEWVDFQLNYWSLQLHSISDQLSEFTLLLIVVGKWNVSAICAIWLTISPYDNDSILLSQFVSHLLFFLIFPVPVIFKMDCPFIVLRPSQIKFPVLYLGLRGDTYVPNLNFKTHFFIEYYRLVIWYNGSFEGGQLCDTKSPCWEGRMPWNKTNAGIYLS